MKRSKKRTLRLPGKVKRINGELYFIEVRDNGIYAHNVKTRRMRRLYERHVMPVTAATVGM